MITPYIMIPLVGERKELKFVRVFIVVHGCTDQGGRLLDAEVSRRHHDRDPARALTADRIAGEVDFFSFGTNDLTQMTFGFSRDDAAKFALAATTTPRSMRATRSSTWTSTASASSWRWPARSWPSDESGARARHLRRARRRSVLRRVLPQGRSGLCPARRSRCRSPVWPRHEAAIRET